MPKYLVVIIRTEYHYGNIEVEANNKLHAKKVALALSAEDFDNANFRIDYSDEKVTNIEKI